MDMKFKFYSVELLIIGTILLRAIFLENLTTIWYTPLFLLLTLVKHLFEGFRLASAAHILGGCLAIIPFLPFILVGLFIALFGIYYFPAYHAPTPSGPYKIGFKDIILKDDLRACLFYPTREESYDSYSYPQEQPKPWDKLMEASKVGKKNIPPLMAKLMTGQHLHKMLGVNTNSPILPTEELPSHFNGQFPVIIHNHGLANSRTSSTFFMKELASRGFIIISVQHNDMIMPPSGNNLDFEFRHNELLKRVSNANEAIDFILNEEKVSHFFGDHTIKINKNAISVCGHSYGGCTATYVALTNKKVTGPCIALDPWYFPMKDEELKGLQKPLLLVRSELFQNAQAGNLARVQKMASHNINNVFYGYFEKSGHNNFTDSGFDMAREHANAKNLAAVKYNTIQYKNHASLLNAFVQNVILDNLQSGEWNFSKESVLKTYESLPHDNTIKFIVEDI